MNAVGLVSNLLAILSFAWVYRRSVGTPWKTRWLWWLGALILALPGLSFSAHYLRVMPETEVYYEFRSLPGIELCLVPIGIFAGLTATFAHRVFLVVPLLGCLGVGLLPFLKPIFIPIPDEEFTHRCEEGVFLQSTASTCGPAATATLLGNVGIVVSEEQLAREAYSSGRGTEAWYLARAARRHGARVSFDFIPKGSPGDEFPAMLGTTIGGTGHFIAILGREGEDYLVADPLRGPEKIGPEALHRRYGFSGFRMRVERSDLADPPTD